MVYRPTARTLQRKEERRKLFLLHAMRLFGERGFHETTVPMIVAAAESSTGAFYLYFRNKEDIFAATLELLGQRIAEAIHRAMAAAGADPLDHMKAAVKGLVAYLADNPEAARILIVESSGLGAQLEAVRRAVIQSHTRSVQQALTVLASRLPAMDAAVAASCWVGAVYEAVYRWLEQPVEGRIPAEQLGECIATYNLRAIGARASGARGE